MSRALRAMAKHPLGLLGLVLILALLSASLLAGLIAPYDPVKADYAKLLAAPSGAHWFGTDTFGRDVLSRVIHGGRSALLIGITASLLGTLLGAMLGISSAYFGGMYDVVAQRLIEIVLCLPMVVLALVIVAALGRREVAGIDFNLILAIAIPIVPKAARVLRAATLAVRSLPYVDAARAAAFSHARILLRHVAPNVLTPCIVLGTAFVAHAILVEASLSYLGLGVAEPTPSWGLMLSGSAADNYGDAPWTLVFPGLAICLAVFGFNAFGDALRDILDPKQKT